MLTIWAW